MNSVTHDGKSNLLRNKQEAVQILDGARDVFENIKVSVNNDENDKKICLDHTFVETKIVSKVDEGSGWI